MLLRRAFSIYRVAGARRLRRHRRDRLRRRTARAPRGSPGCAPHDPVDVVGPLGRPFALPQGAGRPRPWSAAATAPRRCSRSPSSCARAAAGSTSCSAPPPRTGCSARWRPSASSHAVAITTEDGSLGRARAGHRRAARRCWSAPAPTSSTRAGRWRCCARSHEIATALRRAQPVRRRGVDGLRHRRLHDLRAAGRRRRRRDPHGALLRRGPGVPRRPRPVGRRRHRARRTPLGAAGAACDGQAADDPDADHHRAHRRRAHARPTVDMTTDARRRCRCPNPVLTASGCAAAGRELDQFFDLDRARRGRHQVDDARAAVGPPDAADGRDAERDAQLDRPAGPRHRRVPRATTCPGCAERGARAVVSIAGSSVEEYAKLAQRLRHADGVIGDRGQHLLPQRRGPRPGLRLRPRSPRPRSSRRCAATPRPGVPVLAKLSPDVTDIVAVAAVVRRRRRRRPLA